MRVLLLAMLATVGCSKPHPEPTTSPGTPSGEPSSGLPAGTAGGTGTPFDPYCADKIVSTVPTAGDQTMYYLGDVSFLFSIAPYGTEEIVLTGPGGPVPGVTSIDGNQVVFDPDDGLEPMTQYTAVLADCPPSEFGFRTSPTGDPIDPVLAIGTTYAVDIASGTWIQPTGVGGLLAGYLAVDILVGVLDADPVTLTMIGGVSEAGSSSQDLCAETVSFPPADFGENPYFELGPQDLSMQVMGAQLNLFDVHLSGAFRPDFLGIQGASLVGSMDTRGLVELVVPGGTPGDVCALLTTFAVPCVACPDGLPYCVAAEVEDLQVPASPGPLIPRTADDILNDPGCP